MRKAHFTGSIDKTTIKSVVVDEQITQELQIVIKVSGAFAQDAQLQLLNQNFLEEPLVIELTPAQQHLFKDGEAS